MPKTSKLVRLSACVHLWIDSQAGCAHRLGHAGDHVDLIAMQACFLNVECTAIVSTLQACIDIFWFRVQAELAMWQPVH